MKAKVDKQLASNDMTLKQFVDLELGTSLGAENVIIYLKIIIIITKVMIIIVIQLSS